MSETLSRNLNVKHYMQYEEKYVHYDIRIPENLKVMIEMVASTCRVSVTDFWINSVREKALQVIESQRVLSLSQADQFALAQALLSEKSKPIMSPYITDISRIYKNTVVSE